ncbi:hypothetical protein PVAG01_08530 [Phlyctema vagabunda]|uniref:Uncharacterized protein n=1 Tax=Phlyctema vagabunda TaxID=108571 RepID=A0ABR4P9N7_9HELO
MQQLPPAPTQPPMNQQQTRQTSASSAVQYHPPFAPRSQIEAMPPFPAMRSLPAQGPAQIILDAAKRHPVFFTDRLKRAPTGVNTGEGLSSSPIAKGYIFNDGATKKEGGVKL